MIVIQLIVSLLNNKNPIIMKESIFKVSVGVVLIIVSVFAGFKPIDINHEADNSKSPESYGMEISANEGSNLKATMTEDDFLKNMKIEFDKKAADFSCTFQKD